MEMTTSVDYADGSLPVPITNMAATGQERSKETQPIRACTNCVRGKAKCSPTSNADAEGKCERYGQPGHVIKIPHARLLIFFDRCFRMKKICQPSAPVRRQRTLKRPLGNETSKLEDLEGKLDGLVTLLKSATQGVPGIINKNSTKEALESANHEGPPWSMRIADGAGEHISKDHSPTRNGLSGAHYTPPLSHSSTSPIGNGSDFPPASRPAAEPSAEDAELYLARFRAKFIRYLPFIVISESITAYELRRERPILWIAIMTVASNNSTEQLSLSKEMREIIGRHAFVEATKNMDFLLAIMVYVTW